MARVVRWGVWFEGSSVAEYPDGLSAFRAEANWRRRGYDAVAVVSSDGRWWHEVSASSALRPDPRPPVQAPWWQRLWRGGKFRRRDG